MARQVTFVLAGCGCYLIMTTAFFNDMWAQVRRLAPEGEVRDIVDFEEILTDFGAMKWNFGMGDSP